MIKELAEQREPAIVGGVPANRSDIAVEVFVVAVTRDVIGVCVLLVMLPCDGQRPVTGS